MAPNASMLRIAPDVRITHPYLWAWDTLLQSFTGWKEQQQLRAQAANAPADAVFFDGNRWVRFEELEPTDSTYRVERYVREHLTPGAD